MQPIIKSMTNVVCKTATSKSTATSNSNQAFRVVGDRISRGNASIPILRTEVFVRVYRRTDELSDNFRSADTPRLRIAPNNDPSEASIREALQKILTSRLFATSLRQNRFLRYTVEQTLQGKGTTRLKEYLLATEVFDRKDSFDPHVDPIVRVEASRIRAKLKAYYETEGQEDPILIEFPRGTYVPIFRRRMDPVKTIESGPDFPFRGRWMRAILIILLVASVAAISRRVYAVPWIHSLWKSSPDVPAARIASIAVLPFVNSSNQKEFEYFSDGLTDEHINSLTKVESLHVVGRTSVFQFKGKMEDVREIGRKLNVRTVLEGAVRKDGERVRVTVELIDVVDGYQLWSDVYDSENKNVIQIQTDIARAVVKALRVNAPHP